MKALAGPALATVLCTALAGIAVASPPTASPRATLQILASHGLVDGYSAQTIGAQSPSRETLVLLSARAIAHAETAGASTADLALLQRLILTYRDDLQQLGVRVSSASELRRALPARVTETAARDAFATLAAPVDAPLVRDATVPHLRLAAADVPDSIVDVRFRAGDRAPVLPALPRSQWSRYVRQRFADALSAANFQRPHSASASGRAIAHGLIGVAERRSESRHAAVEVADLLFGTGDAPSLSLAPRPAAVAARTAFFDQASSLGGAGAVVAGIEFRPRDGAGPARAELLQNTFGERAASLRLGGAPSALSYNLLPYFPDVFGVSSNAALTAGTFSLLSVTSTPSGSVSYAAPQPFEGEAPAFYSAFAPAASNAASFAVPVHVVGLAAAASLDAQHVATGPASAFDSGPACASVVSCGMISRNPLRDDRISAGTTFHLRAWGRPIALNLGASYDRLTRTDRSAFTALSGPAPLQSGDGATLSALPDAGPISLNPNFVDVTRRSLDARAAVPLTRQVTLNLQYNAQYYAGSYATLGAQSVDQRNDAYLGNITYTIPRTSSSIVFSAKQYRYWDAFVPTYNLTQNRADLNFTVKF